MPSSLLVHKRDGMFGFHLFVNVIRRVEAGALPRQHLQPYRKRRRFGVRPVHPTRVQHRQPPLELSRYLTSVADWHCLRQQHQRPGRPWHSWQPVLAALGSKHAIRLLCSHFHRHLQDLHGRQLHLLLLV